MSATLVLLEELEDLGHGVITDGTTQGTLYRDWMPAEPDEVIVLNEMTGQPVYALHELPGYYSVTVQMLVRGQRSKYRDTEAAARSAYMALADITSLEADRYGVKEISAVTATDTVSLFERDDRERVIFAATFSVAYTPTAD